ncbi:MAG: DUF485 domain-containing protein [Chloroflexota bacterium]|nr:DUF485 domain-containing protein [Chloroflexota bacterium]
MSNIDHDPGRATYTATESQYLAMQDSPEFQELRKRYRGWVLPVAAGALVWYFLYVLLAAYAADFMGQKLVGNINVGLVMGLLQFASTFVVTALYIRHADKSLDPASQRLREKFEGEVVR